MTKRVIVTGGSGLAGKWVVENLVEHGYEVLNLDRVPMPRRTARTLITDITDAGQVFNALASSTAPTEFVPDLEPKPIDAIVHFAAIPRIMVTTDNEVFRINVMGTYNILDAASKLGIRKVIVASSETTYGVVFAHRHRNPQYFPLDEQYPVDPMDSYATSKVINEVTAKAFHARTGADLYCFRIGNVLDPEDYAKFTQWNKDPSLRKRIAWSYIDGRDLAEAARLGIEKDGLGFEVMNIAADDVSSDLPTAELLKRFYPEVPVKKQLGEFETLLSNEKLKRLLGWKQKYYWRDQVK
ncbi:MULTISPECIES: NAD(P)-dependent oxidoreductase [Paraburkholderia]|jgi:nucleoside-diphosphate-sugar epimerase|uniref:Nucleoside-diphosphate-sugar epimerase n=1 Tax=Paraburkholderia largidicola TaxID=3014751 RepID=A0A7I8BZB1_9BURK|nr:MULTISPECIES: NAD(P)-dependent oxidoreductase [Paraburkholderia]BCF94136.1 nucleoside-diphosphate-sugar epimerase [Paraburkholderia sp. PGU16]GJH01061.1 NAD(P)-dependent oxidoreductase [Paraburkholderia terrae]